MNGGRCATLETGWHHAFLQSGTDLRWPIKPRFTFRHLINSASPAIGTLRGGEGGGEGEYE